MAYVKNNWVDREGTTRYFETVDGDGAKIFTPDYTQVTELGTPVNADNMNHIEDGIAAGSFTKYDSMTTYAKEDLVTAIEENELKIYKSLQDNNTSALADSSFWEKVEFSGGGAGLQLFDTILKDHVLTYEETKGLALQGTYVYKEALAGSRYGYPDFYAKCVEEYNEATNTETVNGVTVKVHSNGHKFYDIADKGAIDTFFGTMGSAWFYGVDVENERIFLPRNNYFIQATGNGSEVGQSVQAGLPNITGYVSHSVSGSSHTSSGAMTINVNSNMKNVFASGSGMPVVQYNLDASRSSSVYGNSNTVQPNAVKQLLYICVGNTTNYEGVTEVVNQGMEILEQVAQKVNVDGTNLNNEGKSLFASYGRTSSKVIDLTLGASGTTYVAPATGTFYIWKAASASGQYFCFINNSRPGASIIYSPTTSAQCRLTLDVVKGDEIRVDYTLGGATRDFRFIYALGSESEAQ